MIAPAPDQFVVGFTAEVEAENRMTVEFVPEGETVENWTQMMSVLIFRNTDNGDPAAFHGLLAQNLQATCPNGAVSQQVTGGAEFGTPFDLILGGCTLADGQGEYFLSKAMGGRDAMYVVQGAWRGVLQEAEVVQWSQHLRGVYVCDTRRPDAPCPATE